MSGISRSGSVAGQPNILIIMVDQLNGMLFDHGPKSFLHAPHLKNLAKNSVCFSTCYTRAHYVRRDGLLLCRASCHHAQGSMTMRPNLPRPSRPMRIMCAVMVITRFWLARCIMWDQTSFMALKPGPQPIFIRLILAGHQIIANRVSVLIGGIII